MSEHRPVLYVEDEPILRKLAEVILEDAGFEVVAAESGHAAFEALDEDGKPWCALVTDVNLGDGPDGWAVGRLARKLSPGLPVVYVTGGSADQWQAQGVPDSLLLTKPFTPAQIVDAIRALLARA
jgi:CheY-like chemotaxis protein